MFWRTLVQWFLGSKQASSPSSRQITATQWALNDSAHGTDHNTRHNINIEIIADPLIKREAHPPRFKITHTPSDRLH